MPCRDDEYRDDKTNTIGRNLSPTVLLCKVMKTAAKGRDVKLLLETDQDIKDWWIIHQTKDRERMMEEYRGKVYIVMRHKGVMSVFDPMGEVIPELCEPLLLKTVAELSTNVTCWFGDAIPEGARGRHGG